jgi:O-antigen/teichoic acid export membrane protein
VSHWFVIVCLILWVGVSSNLFWIQGLFLRQAIYWEGIAVVPVLLLANLFLGVYYTQSVWFKKTNKTYMGTLITVTGLAVTLIGNVLFIPIYGYMACAYSFLTSAIVMTLLCYVGGQKYDPAPYRWMAAIVYISLGVFAIASGALLARLEIPMIISQNIGFICILAYIFIQEFSWKNGKPSLALK